MVRFTDSSCTPFVCSSPSSAVIENILLLEEYGSLETRTIVSLRYDSNMVRYNFMAFSLVYSPLPMTRPRRTSITLKRKSHLCDDTNSECLISS